jgi:hypothetical protein
VKGLLAILGKPSMSKDKGSSPHPMMDEEEEAPESGRSEAAEYKSVIADAAKAGDWDAFADAVAGLVSCSK